MVRDSFSTAAGWGILRIDCSQSRDGTLTVRLHGELDIYSAGELYNSLRESEPGCTDVVVDLSDLVFIDCAGLHQIVEAGKRAQARGCTLTLIDGPPAIRRLFALTGLASAFQFRTLANEGA